MTDEKTMDCTDCTDCFNGGKMRHYFEFDPNNTSRNPTYDLTKPSPYAGWTIRDARVKIDGACGMVKMGEDGRYHLYERQDVGEKGVPADQQDKYVPLPPGSCEQSYSSTDPRGREKKHAYYFRRVQREEGEARSKNYKKVWEPLYAIVDRAQADGKLVKPYYTCELVGPNFQRTPGVEVNGVALHEMQRRIELHVPTITVPVMMKVILTQGSIEGFILHLVRGEEHAWVKVRSDCFGPKMPWSMDRASADAPTTL